MDRFVGDLAHSTAIADYYSVIVLWIRVHKLSLDMYRSQMLQAFWIPDLTDLRSRPHFIETEPFFRPFSLKRLELTKLRSKSPG